MKKNFVNFGYNVKMYFKYISKVGFKELLFDTIILLCMIVIAGFAFVPVDLLEDIIRGLVEAFVDFNAVGGAVFTWVFNVIATFCSIILFIILFNGRYDFKNNKVVPIEGSVVLKREDDLNPDKEKEESPENKENELPKEKEEK